MTGFTDRILVYVFGVYLLMQNNSDYRSVIALLIALTAAAFCFYLKSRLSKGILIALYFISCCFLPELVFFLPIFFYDCMTEHFYWGLLGILPFLFAGFQTEIVLWFLISLFSILLAYRTQTASKANQELIQLRDSTTEINMILKEKNKTLQDNQDYEIHVATLRERNRIAREIHDNVGHMLSRSILQMGALMTIHKEEPLHEQLGEVNNTLNKAMTSIRESVHDLHDESIDMKQVITELVAPMQANYQVSLQYDMSSNVIREVKFCFINILKEALANIVKHSNATKIDIILREQPGFYQLSIEDNGTISKNTSSDGIGLSNMQDRVEKLNGLIRITTPETSQNATGYKIFISIPKL